MTGKRTWTDPSRWTFQNEMVYRAVGGPMRWGIRRRRGYELPAEPTLLGEVLLRGIVEGV
jgi:hypothetical protein